MALVEVKRVGDLGILVLNNGKLNELSLDTFNDLGTAFDGLSQNDATKVIVLTANPGPIFCAGADVNMIAEVAQLGDRGKITELLSGLHELVNRIDACPKRTIAAVNGVCFGGGLELALAFDYIVAAPLAQFALPEVSLGIIPGLGGTQRLPRRIGFRPALQLMLTGERISATKAADLCLVDRVIEGDFIVGIKAFAAEVLSGSIEARPGLSLDDIEVFSQVDLLEYGKGRSEHAASLAVNAAYFGAQADLRDGLVIEIEHFVDAVTHPDATAGITAFFEKKPPVFEKVIGA